MKEFKDFRDFLVEEDGIGVVEIILILVVLIGLIAIFKNKMSTLIGDIFSSISTKWKAL